MYFSLLTLFFHSKVNNKSVNILELYYYILVDSFVFHWEHL